MPKRRTVADAPRRPAEDSPRQQIRFAVARDGVRIAYSVAGSGPPLVKAAHWLSHIEHDWQSPIWRPWLHAIARRYTLIRYDERGCGLSDRDVGTFSFDDWVADLETVVEASGFERVALLGMSQGGAIALAYAVRRPERVSRIVLWGAYVRGRERRDPTPREREESQTLIRLVKLGWGREQPAFSSVFTSMFIPDADAEKRRSFVELQRVSASPETATAIVALFDAIDVQELAQRVRAPTLVLHGRDDTRVPFDEGRRLAASIPGARLVSLDTASHILQAGDPALDRFMLELDAFMATAPAVEPRTSAALHTLTRRERDVLELIARGLDNASIAKRLFVSGATVRNHVTHIFAKLDVRTRAHAVARARDAGYGRDD
jgi:pimeloyl-ACP methyl ester carboxylesterase